MGRDATRNLIDTGERAGKRLSLPSGSCGYRERKPRRDNLIDEAWVVSAGSHVGGEESAATRDGKIASNEDKRRVERGWRGQGRDPAPHVGDGREKKKRRSVDVDKLPRSTA